MDSDNYLKTGLDSDQLRALHHQHGPNQLEGKPPPTDLDFLIRQFKNPLVLVLVGAGLITLVLQEYTDATVIGLAIVVNTVLGFIQERNAQRGLEALKNFLTPQAVVIRNGQQQTIDARELVPGDVVLLYDGDKIPADGIIVKSHDLLINEAILTGESEPVGKNRVKNQESRKKNNEINDPVSSLLSLDSKNLDASHQAFMGTIAASGSGTMIVTSIGMQTEIGKIAASLESEQEKHTPLEIRLNQLAKWLTIIVIIASILVFLYGFLIVGMHIEEIFTLTVALAVAAIPEGLVVSLTAILAIGMQRILKKKALVRKLVAAETLGTVSVVCVDKTGTLTEGKLRVIDADFTDWQLGLRASALANDLRDSTEIARWSWLRELSRGQKSEVRSQKLKIQNFETLPAPFRTASGKLETRNSKLSIPDPQVLVKEYSRDDTIAFSSENKFMATRHGREIFIVGAPEIVLGWTSYKLKAKSYQLIESWASQGRRLIGLAYYQARTLEHAEQTFQHLKNHKFDQLQLNWLGLIAYADPIREGVKTALIRAGHAGISVKVITGDYRPTAEAVLTELGIDLPDGSVMEGFELEKLTDAELQGRINQIKLFARTRPNQKMRIVKALKANRQVVAMMGDGVNDAPAIAAADIGIVVGEASEVAREQADIVLLDSNFRTILDAVAEGRGIFDNLRKIVIYLLSGVFTEMILVVGSLLAGWPLAITAVQILWINLIGDGFPNLALTVDPRDKNVLKRQPVDSKLPIIDRKMFVIMAAIGISTGITGLAAFRWAFPLLGTATAQTIAFQVVGVDSLFYVFSCRVLDKNIWEKSILENKWLLLSVFFGFLLMILPVYTPGLSDLLGTVPLGLTEWLVVLLTSAFVIVSVEGTKWVMRKV